MPHAAQLGIDSSARETSEGSNILGRAVRFAARRVSPLSLKMLRSSGGSSPKLDAAGFFFSASSSSSSELLLAYTSSRWSMVLAHVGARAGCTLSIACCLRPAASCLLPAACCPFTHVSPTQAPANSPNHLFEFPCYPQRRITGSGKRTRHLFHLLR